ncbi:MAG TPA: 3-methyl-2-oxobutanoate hydroxymethyltransferase [bacterium]|nr:3-methyl-2-oxobutanoate hydroxymethyltransferase [bacterium]
MERKKVDIGYLQQKKKAGEKITMLTAYDYPTAKILDEAGVETILVGDSAANVVLGYPDTVPVTFDELLVLNRAVRKAVQYAFVIGDMPFGSYNVSAEQAIVNGTRFMKEAGSDAVKLEGGGVMIDKIRAMTQAGIPVVGHLGLTPQTASMIGGYRVQGNTAEKAQAMIADAKAIAAAGAIMLVLECVPGQVAGKIASLIDIPVIGIGAGADIDGQVLVLHDMLGFNPNVSFKFLKTYGQIGPEIGQAVKAYVQDVKQKEFPAAEHTFTIPAKEWNKIKDL